MPPLTWHPEFERYATLGALAHCEASYYWTRQVADGAIPAEPTSEAAAIGLAFDAGVTAWQCEKVPVDAMTNSEGWDSLSHVQRQCVQEGVDQHIRQWDGVRPWKLLAAHPYEDDAERARWVLFDRFLAMPDLVVEVPGGAILTVDIKTSKYPYHPQKWSHDMQLMTQALAARRRYPEAPIVGSLVDYAKLPNKSDTGMWTFPATVEMWLTPEREAAVSTWLGMQLLRANEVQHRPTSASQHPDGWRHLRAAPYACQTPYGPCQWRGRCWGEG